MIFSSVTFLFIFLPLVLALYYIPLKSIASKNILLLIASFVFYAIGEPIYIAIMLFSICINFRFGILIHNANEMNKQEHKKYLLMIAVGINLAILFLFKYENFMVSNVNKLFGTEVKGFGLVLPIGISFYTFQSISYIIDVYRNSVPVQKSISKLGLYIAFFPQLVAGPIVRYSTINEQIDNRKTTLDGFADGVRMFLCGVAKKIILANNFSVVSTYAFTLNHDELSICLAWLGSICYTLQIFFDFSGYSDMAIGLAKMFGFEFDRNFNYPYISKSSSEFWRRWHISLGSWFRDYVYIPLGGSRVSSKLRLVANLFVVWFLTGIWHGAAWQFMVWGLVYFIVLTFEKLTGFPEKSKNIFMKFIYQIFTLFLVNFCWIIFGQPDLENAFYYILSMFGLYGAEGNEFMNPMFEFHLGEIRTLLVFGILASTPIFKLTDEKIVSNVNQFQYNVYQCMKSLVAVLFLAISISYLAMGAHNPFIYFNF